MQQPSAIHDTFVLERHFPKSAEAVYAALSEPGKRRRWFAEGGDHEIQQFDCHFEVGGSETLCYRLSGNAPAPVAGLVLLNQTRFEDIVPGRRIVTSSVMTLGPARVSASLVTMELLPNGDGTDLICTHQGTFFEGSGGPRMREEGWRQLLGKLASELSKEDQ